MLKEDIRQYTEEQIDLLQEIINIGVGRAASSLSQLVESRVNLCVPKISLYTTGEAKELFESRQILEETMVMQSFTGSVHGRLGMILDKKSALLLTTLLGENEITEDEISLEQEGILLEVGNILLNGVMGSISNAIEDQLEYSIPELDRTNSIQALLSGTGKTGVLLADVTLHVEDSSINGSIVIAFDINAINAALNNMMQQI